MHHMIHSDVFEISALDVGGLKVEIFPPNRYAMLYKRKHLAANLIKHTAAN